MNLKQAPPERSKKVMLKLKGILLGAAVVSAVAFSLPAVAQFEVAPDHFRETGTRQSRDVAAVPRAELDNAITAQKERLGKYQDQLRAEEESVKNARELAAGAGAMGEAAAVFVDDYVRQSRELEQLRHTLSPQIAQAQANLQILEQQLATNVPTSPVETATPKPVFAASGSRPRHRRVLTATSRVPR